MSRYDITVSTVFLRADGSLFADLGTFKWPGVSDAMRVWLAGSCRSTALRMVSLPEHAGGYVLQYQTIVREAGTDSVISDTGLIEFAGLSYQQVLDFERFALTELSTMIDLFAAEHVGTDATPRRRSKVLTLMSWFRSWWRAQVRS